MARKLSAAEEWRRKVTAQIHAAEGRAPYVPPFARGELSGPEKPHERRARKAREGPTPPAGLLDARDAEWDEIDIERAGKSTEEIEAEETERQVQGIATELRAAHGNDIRVDLEALRRGKPPSRSWSPGRKVKPARS
jgi:hypothetical protein